jgi:deoxyribodipyrimidine photo-lyase
MLKQTISIFWFRRDLRLHDNAALYHAVKNNKAVIPVFIFDKIILDKLEDKDDKRVVFIHEALSQINNQLKKLKTGLVTYYSTPLEAWKKITQEYNVTQVYTNHDYEPYAKERDEQIKLFLQTIGISFHTYKDQTIFEKDEVVKDDGLPYTVFTPYSRKWKAKLNEFYLKSFPTEKYFSNFFQTAFKELIPLEQLGFKKTDVDFPSKEIIKDIINNYGEQRNIPSIKGTSQLSVHLRFGTVSIRELATQAKHLSEPWLNELIWRDFYMMILWHFPHVTSAAFKQQYNKINWNTNEEEFYKWCNGQTGYPIVDAGMRELNATGFMHNRLRMIVASFLTKHLLINWQWGEAYFAKKLLDFDLSANNGGWQWAAGSGCDAAPYFRIFNPYEQTRKFDPQLKYIREWVPEFEDFSYPPPMVEHVFARNRCLTRYREVLSAEKN